LYYLMNTLKIVPPRRGDVSIRIGLKIRERKSIQIRINLRKKGIGVQI